MVEVKKEKEEYYYEDLIEEDRSSASPSSFSSSSFDTITTSPSLQGRVTGPTRWPMKGGWTKEEDNLLIEAVKKCNARNWKGIAEFLPGRTDIQCLHRWQKVLNPGISKGPWTKELMPYAVLTGLGTHVSDTLIVEILDMGNTGGVSYYQMPVHFNEKGTIDDSIVGSVTRYDKHTRVHEPQPALFRIVSQGGCALLASTAVGSPSSSLAFNPESKIWRTNTAYSSDCSLHNEPAQREGSISTVFPVVENGDIRFKSSFCHASPPNKLIGSLSPNSRSLESILRISAMTFKNTPSIIRKRSYKKGWNHNISESAASYPVRNFSCFHMEEM
ncbi:myb-related protein B-like [Gossypium australe]|uniref:Myb-related protein B-like n=1 Tax=Gossypium australe TaxID=47621 RepID=A0A5B6UI16_9ROSI|nr:myb-related protein B-like [Gossypium australe]